MREIFPFKLSPLTVKIAAGNTEIIPVTTPQTGLTLFIQSFEIKVFCEQAKQDLITSLQVGKKVIYQSGKVKSTSTDFPYALPIPAVETRDENISGLPYTEISSTTGVGYPDNFTPENKRLFYPVSGEEFIYFKVKNQSAVYEHAIVLELSGLLISAISKEAANV